MLRQHQPALEADGSKSQMRIAVIWSRFGPYHLARLEGVAAEAAQRGVRVAGVEVAATDRDYAWARAEGAHGFDRLTLFPRADYHTLSSGEITRGVKEALDHLSPVAVAINGWSVPEARAAAAWCRRHGRRVVVMSETKADDHDRLWWKEVIKRRIVPRFDAALVGGRPHAEYLMSLGFPRKRIHYGYDAVDNDYFGSRARAVRPEAMRLRRELGLPEHYFVACTRFLARKNVDGLLRAYKLYRERSKGRAWGMVIMGSGEEGRDLHALAGALGLGDVRWPGFVQYDRLPFYYGLAGAFVHPAKAEPWGLVVNEAAASGLPILASKTVGACYELVREGENGWLFDPFDEEDMARTLARMAEMQAPARAQMGQRSAAIVAEWTPLRFGRELLAAAGFAGRVEARKCLA